LANGLASAQAPLPQKSKKGDSLFQLVKRAGHSAANEEPPSGKPNVQRPFQCRHGWHGPPSARASYFFIMYRRAFSALPAGDRSKQWQHNSVPLVTLPHSTHSRSRAPFVYVGILLCFWLFSFMAQASLCTSGSFHTSQQLQGSTPRYAAIKARRTVESQAAHPPSYVGP
jgi:hypothetical protein